MIFLTTLRCLLFYRGTCISEIALFLLKFPTLGLLILANVCVSVVESFFFFHGLVRLFNEQHCHLDFPNNILLSPPYIFLMKNWGRA